MSAPTTHLPPYCPCPGCRVSDLRFSRREDDEIEGGAEDARADLAADELELGGEA